jgi:hypothetical protein
LETAQNTNKHLISHTPSWIIWCRQQENQPLQDRKGHPGRATKEQIEAGNQQQRLNHRINQSF